MTSPAETPLRSRMLTWAAVYNLAFGALCVITPQAAFSLVGAAPPEPLASALWQCIGMIVGVYGVGYAIASADAARHWPIVFIGLLGKILGPIGFVWAASRGAIEWRFLIWIVANDLVWWIPFAALLRRASQRSIERDIAQNELTTREALDRARLDGGQGKGRTLTELSHESALLLVMMRHAGCVFCREMVAKLARDRAAISAAGKRIVIVHMSSDADMERLLVRHRLEDLGRISDPARVFYRALGLRRGTPAEIAAPRVWWRAFVATLISGHGIGKVDGDVWQMPGVFLVKDGQLTWGRQLSSVAEIVDFAAIAQESQTALAVTQGRLCTEHACSPTPASPVQL